MSIFWFAVIWKLCIASRIYCVILIYTTCKAFCCCNLFLFHSNAHHLHRALSNSYPVIFVFRSDILIFIDLWS
ncbi:hypothetical protein Y032_0233g3116 [Ancylostoma ceylanicum]|nr:hypothetical protein Y032_0233g3116 [Ancylostoma ceylanicum]